MSRTSNIIDPIHGSIEFSELELLIVDTPPFQRLRKIKQLGNVHLVFPGATHNRFSHSLGVMHLAGRLFDALVRSHRQKVGAEVIDRVRVRIRLAALLHDVGHGPFSHQFEEFLKKQRLTLNDLSPELQLPKKWRSKERDSESKLSHEDFSFGIIKYIFDGLNLESRFSISPQDLCSLLDDDIQPSDDFVKDLKAMAKAIGNSENYLGLKNCFKAILSGEIDADRLDYLQRDSLYCGCKIAGIDVDHILNSINLSLDSKKEYFIQLNLNALVAVEQVLISRKMMFDQVYTHHVNAGFDDMLIGLMSKSLKYGTPLTYKWYLNLTDESVERLIEKQISTIKTLGKLDLEAKFFSTRTTLKKVFTMFCAKFDLDKTKFELNKIWDVDGAKREIITFQMKDFTKLDRDKNTGKRSLLKIKSDYQQVDPKPINLASEVFKSSLWRTDSVKVIVFENIEASSNIRNLEAKLNLLDLKVRSQTSQKAGSVKKLKRG